MISKSKRSICTAIHNPGNGSHFSPPAFSSSQALSSASLPSSNASHHPYFLMMVHRSTPMQLNSLCRDAIPTPTLTYWTSHASFRYTPIGQPRYDKDSSLVGLTTPA